MRNPIIVLFLVVLIITLVWFVTLGVGRSKANNGDTSATTIYVLITTAMAFLGETLLNKHAIVQALTRQHRLLKQRTKREQAKVTTAQQNIIGVQKQGFWWEQNLDRFRAAHRIAKDHALAEHEPCAR